MDQIETVIAQLESRPRRGYEDPYRQLAAAVLLRAVQDLNLGKKCHYLICKGTGHACRESALRFLTEPEGIAAYFMECLDLDRWRVLRELGLLGKHYDPDFEWGNMEEKDD